MKRGLHERGQVGTDTLIYIAIGAIVLLTVALVYYDVGKIRSSLFGGESNVKTVAFKCESACNFGAEYDYCSLEQELKAADLKGITLAGKTYAGSAYGSCYAFATAPEFKKYGITACQALCATGKKSDISNTTASALNSS